MSFIVVGLDGSETSRRAFREAVQEAQWREARLVALHVVHHPYVGVDGFAAAIPMEDLRPGAEALVARELETLRAGYGEDFPIPVEPRVVMGHSGVEVIKAASGASEGPAELVVLGSRGMGGFRGLLLGSVTTYAAHHLSCRLLIVPAEHE